MTRIGKNPFTPTFGKVPALMTGREDILAELTQAFEDGSGNPNLSTIITGARGTGKTALLLHLSRIAQEQGWISVNVSCIPGMLEEIEQQTYEAAADLVDKPEHARLKSVTIGSVVGVEWDNPDIPAGTWRSRIARLLKTLNDKNAGLVITVDEVQPNLDEMVQLASIYQHFVGEDRKVALLLAGLPGKVSSLLRNESVSFLRRANRYALRPIADEEIARGIRYTIESGGRTIQEPAISEAVKESRGFPYLMQLVGFQSWNQHPNNEEITLDDVRVGAALAHKNFVERVLDATYFDLSQNDIRFLQAMLLDKSESRLSDIAQRLGEPSNYTSTYKRRLMEQGIIGERGPSFVTFELPWFRDYLMEKCGPLA